MGEGDGSDDGRGILHPEGMQAARDMASGVVHEVNNLLGVIIGNAHLAKKSGSDPKALERYVSEIRSAAEEGRDLMRSLGALANGHPTRPRALSLNDLARGAVVGSKVRASLDLSERDPIVEVDPWLAQEALGALVDFMAATASSSFVRVATRIVGDAVALTLEDDGPSPSEGEVRALFTPFAKADRRPKTGMRLTKLADLASRFGGRVSATAREPHGLQVVLTLPLAPRGSGDGPGVPLAQ